MTEYLIKHKELIIILASLGTFVSALIAVFTLIEIKKQRLSLYLPDILIKAFTISISKNPLQKENDEIMYYKTSVFNDYSVDYNEVEFEVHPKYKVDNVGFGVAKNLVCEWCFDTKKAIKEIEKTLPNNFRINWYKSLNLYVLEDLNNKDFHYSANANIDEQEIDYITPINVQEHAHFHTIPDIVVFCHYLYLIFVNDLVHKSADNFHHFEYFQHKFPSPILKVKYKDINGKRHKKKYKFNITAVDTQIGKVVDLTKEFAYLEFSLK